jgi:hypothetical protein
MDAILGPEPHGAIAEGPSTATMDGGPDTVKRSVTGPTRAWLPSRFPSDEVPDHAVMGVTERSPQLTDRVMRAATTA